MACPTCRFTTNEYNNNDNDKTCDDDAATTTTTTTTTTVIIITWIIKITLPYTAILERISIATFYTRTIIILHTTERIYNGWVRTHAKALYEPSAYTAITHVGIVGIMVAEEYHVNRHVIHVGMYESWFGDLSNGGV
jgi:hypothetical protein